MNIEVLQQRLKPIFRKHGKKIIASAIGIIAVVSAYNYYDTHIVKRSPEYMVEQLTKAINSGDRDTVYKLVNLYGLIDETSKTVNLLNLKTEDWANGSDVLSANANREDFVAAIAENILSNIAAEHKIMYTGTESDVVANGIRMLGINDLEFESIQLSNDKSSTPILNITVHDLKKQDVKYVVHIRMKRVNDQWILDQLMSADTVIKTRLIDYKQNLSEENKSVIALFNRLVKIETVSVSVTDQAPPDLSPKELFNLSKEEKEKLFKLKSKLKFEAPVLLDPKVQSAKIIVTFANKDTGTIIKEFPVDIKSGSKSLSYFNDVDYTDKAQETLVEAIKKGKVITTVTIQSVVTPDGTTTLKQ